MDDGKSCKEAKSDAHSVEEVFKKLQICPQGMVEMTVMDHVDALTFVEFALNVKKELIHSPAVHKFIYQP